LVKRLTIIPTAFVYRATPSPTDMLASRVARLVGSVTEAEVIPEEADR